MHFLNFIELLGTQGKSASKILILFMSKEENAIWFHNFNVIMAIQIHIWMPRQISCRQKNSTIPMEFSKNE